MRPEDDYRMVWAAAYAAAWSRWKREGLGVQETTRFAVADANIAVASLRRHDEEQAKAAANERNIGSPA